MANNTPQLQVYNSVCPLDCPDTCALRVTFDGDKMVKLEGDPEHPITQGFAYVKMNKYPERQEHPDRLEVPQRQVGPKGKGEFESISWDEALDTIVERVKANIAKVSTDVRRGVVVARGQWWPKLAPDKQSLNALTSQQLTDLGEGSLFGNSVVRIRPAGS